MLLYEEMGVSLGGELRKGSSMEMPWRPALVVGGGVAALLLLRQVVVAIRKKKKTKKKTARASFDPNNNEDEVEHEQIAAETHAEVSKQKDPTAHSVILKGDLRAVIDKEMRLHQAPPFPEPVAMHIIMQLAMGLKGLHEFGIYHRDLKADNVLVEKKMMGDLASYVIYISDFECSEDVIGTKFYRAPEVLRRVEDRMQGRVRGRVRLPEEEWAAADVYSFGMVCYEILTGKVPMIGESFYDYSKALSGERPELPPDVPEGLRIIIQRCWHEDPERRPKLDEIISLLKKIDNYGVASEWFLEVEWMAVAVRTSGSLEEDLLELQDILSKHTGPYPEYIISAMEFSKHVEEFIPKFLAFSQLPQQSFPLQKYMELRKLLTLIDWKKCCFSREVGELSDNALNLKCLRMMALMKSVHTATNKTILQRSRLAQERLPMEEKMLIFLDFVLSLLSVGVHMHIVIVETEIVIRQLDERWALRALRNVLCLLCWLECEIRLFIPALLAFGFSSQILGRILLHFLGEDYKLLWYLNFSPAIGFRLFVQRYIVSRGTGHWFPRFLYLYFLGNGEYFKYWFPFQFGLCIVQNCLAYKQTDFSPHCYFEPINSSTL